MGYDHVCRFTMVKLIHLLVTFLLRFIFTHGTPHTNIMAIQEQLKSLGYLEISCDDNYESSFKCNACQVMLKYQKSFQAIWLLKCYAVEKTHQVRAGWILNDQNVKRSKPKGKGFFYYLVLCYVH